MEDIEILRKAISRKHPCDECHKALDRVESLMKKLLHHKETTVGLWATDRPDLFSKDQLEKFYMVEIKE